MLSSWNILFAADVDEAPEFVRDILTVTVDALVLQRIICVTRVSAEAVTVADSLA